MRKTMLYLVALFCTLLVTTAPVFAGGEEPIQEGYAVMTTCQPVSNHQQEIRWCKTWESALTSSDWLRPVEVGDNSHLQMIIIAEYCEKTQTLGVATTVVFVSPWFAGQYPWLMLNLKVLESGTNWDRAIEGLLVDMRSGFEISVEGLMESIIELHQKSKSYKGVGVEDDRYFEDDTIDRAWPSLLPQLCRGTDFMFQLSRAG